VKRIGNMRAEVCEFCGSESGRRDELTGDVMCVECRSRSLSFDEAERYQIALAEATVARVGAYTRHQVRSIRERYRMRQDQFEKALGVGKKTVGRWERGTVPPIAAANSLLWIADHEPQAFCALARENGVNVSSVATTIAEFTSLAPNWAPLAHRGKLYAQKQPYIESSVQCQ
jgi:putative zinc finger/helix-turn-helix YgiT family protein